MGKGNLIAKSDVQYIAGTMQITHDLICLGGGSLFKLAHGINPKPNNAKIYDNQDNELILNFTIDAIYINITLTETFLKAKIKFS